MHDIEPFFKWRTYYIASEDRQSPFYKKTYSEFTFSNKIYNYFIHPQWDFIGSSTLYAKVLFVDYTSNVAIIELIGEWNDLLHNDIMILKRAIVDKLVQLDIHKFILLCDNVLNFHGDDDSYYEEWWEDVKEEGGWVAIVNIRDHIVVEMERTGIQYYANFSEELNDINWQSLLPKNVIIKIESIIHNQIKQLDY